MYHSDAGAASSNMDFVLHDPEGEYEDVFFYDGGEDVIVIDQMDTEVDASGPRNQRIVLPLAWLQQAVEHLERRYGPRVSGA